MTKQDGQLSNRKVHLIIEVPYTGLAGDDAPHEKRLGVVIVMPKQVRKSSKQ